MTAKRDETAQPTPVKCSRKRSMKVRAAKSTATTAQVPAAIARASGRPSKFDTLNMALLQKLAEYGHDDEFMAKCCGVTERTWNNWKKKHPEFFQSLKDWKAVADDQVVKALFERATGCTCTEERFGMKNGEPTIITATKHYPPDPTSMIFWLKNRRPGQWRDKQELAHSGGLNVTVNVTTCKESDYPARHVDAKHVDPPMLEGEVIEQQADGPAPAPAQPDLPAEPSLPKSQQRMDAL